MKMRVGLLTVLALLAASAGSTVVSAQTNAPATTSAPGNVYSGEVWTWDDRNNVVTLRQGSETIRVRVTPDELRRLQLHQYASIRGELAPPAEVPQTLVNAGPVTAVPRGTATQTELMGTVSAAAPDGRLSITTPRGPLHVWVASGVEQRLAAGTAVRVAMSVQPVDYVPAASASSNGTQPAVSQASAPADYSVVTGRVLGVDPGGRLVVESPVGPIQVVVSDASAFRMSQPVQVRTTVSKME